MENQSQLESYRVYKSNSLVEASYRLNLEEQRLILASIAQLDSRHSGKQTIVKVTARDYAETFDIDMKSAYQQLKTASDRLYERDIRAEDPDTGEIVRKRWVSSVKYQSKQGYVVLGFAPEVEGYLFELTERFTSYRLGSVASLKSIYAIRIYELIMQYKNLGKPGRRIDLDALRHMLVIQDKYPRFADLRKRVLDPAIRELDNSSDMLVWYEPIKEGRSIVAIMLYGEEQKQQKLL
jgi:plasmid replication initiation protein